MRYRARKTSDWPSGFGSVCDCRDVPGVADATTCGPPLRRYARHVRKTVEHRLELEQALLAGRPEQERRVTIQSTRTAPEKTETATQPASHQGAGALGRLCGRFRPVSSPTGRSDSQVTPKARLELATSRRGDMGTVSRTQPKRDDHPPSASILSDMRDRGGVSCQNVLTVLRWLDRNPEASWSGVNHPVPIALFPKPAQTA